MIGSLGGGPRPNDSTGIKAQELFFFFPLGMLGYRYFLYSLGFLPEWILPERKTAGSHLCPQMEAWEWSSHREIRALIEKLDS